MVMILSFTDDAIAHIKGILAKHPEGAMFRLAVKETGCSGYMYMPEIVTVKKEQDMVLPITEIPVLLDPDCISLIEGTVVHFVKKDLGMSQLSFDNPNAEGLCGCGESFKLKNATQ